MDITRIDKDNIEAYEPFLTPEMNSAILSGEVISLGAFDDEADNAPTGIVIGEVEEDAFRIRYLLVDPERRREGIGSYLLDYLSQACLMNEIETFIAEYPDDGSFDDAEAFFDDGGFTKEKGEAIKYVMELGDVKKLRIFKDIENHKDPVEIQSFKDIKKGVLTAFTGELYKEGDTQLYDLLNDGISDGEISLAYVKEDKILALLVASADEKGIIVNWAYSDPNEYEHLLSVIKAFAARAAQKFSDDTEMSILGMTEAAQGLLEGLFKESIKTKTGWTVRKLGF